MPRRHATPACCCPAPTVKRFAEDIVGPKVREMDESEVMDPAVISGLFEQGVRRLPLAS